MTWVMKLTTAGWTIKGQLATHLQAEAEDDVLASQPWKAMSAMQSIQTTVPGQV